VLLPVKNVDFSRGRSGISWKRSGGAVVGHFKKVTRKLLFFTGFKNDLLLGLRKSRFLLVHGFL
jgi:hypothetical protein